MHFVLDLRKLSQILLCKIMRQLAPAGVHGVTCMKNRNYYKYLALLVLIIPAFAYSGDLKIDLKIKEKLTSIELTNGLTAFDYFKNKANFDGHYEVVEWGCGAPCTMSSIINLESGEIIESLNSCYGLNFKIDSNVLSYNNLYPGQLPGCDNDTTYTIKNEKLVKNM